MFPLASALTDTIPPQRGACSVRGYHQKELAGNFAELTVKTDCLATAI